MSLSDITPPIILAALRKPERKEHYEPAHRVKQRIAQVFGYAMAHGRADRARPPIYAVCWLILHGRRAEPRAGRNTGQQVHPSGGAGVLNGAL